MSPLAEVAQELAEVGLLLNQVFDILVVNRGGRVNFLDAGLGDLFEVVLHLLIALLGCDEASGLRESETLVQGTERGNERETDHDTPN